MIRAMLAFSKDDLERVPTVDISQANASKSDVTVDSIWSHHGINNGRSQVDKSVPTKVLIHGYASHPKTPWYELIRDEYFKNGPNNVIFIDWSKIANLPYLQSAANVGRIAEWIAETLIEMKITPESIHIIGHSLGGHIAGFVGKHYYEKTGSKLSRITALDPAGPGFERIDPKHRINSNDADFVDVVHTDMGYFGFTQPVGHVDFYPNGGQDQPGCIAHAGLDSECSHSRAAYLYAESINFRAKAAVQAEFLGRGDIKVIEDGDKIVFGDATPHTARGVFYLDTNPLLPFLI